MDTAIQVIWWIAIVVALIGTVVILKQVALILRTLSGIHRLSVRTLEAARGIARGVEAVPSLPALGESSRALRSSTSDIATAADSIERKLTALSSAETRGGQ